MSNKQALAFSLLAVSAFISFLYLLTFAGILLSTYSNGSFVIVVDRMMFAEGIILTSTSIALCSLAVYSGASIASDFAERLVAHKQSHGGKIFPKKQVSPTGRRNSIRSACTSHAITRSDEV